MPTAPINDSQASLQGSRTQFNLRVGESLHRRLAIEADSPSKLLRHDGQIRWVYVALRGIADGTLGVYADWKIDYSPTAQLLERV